MNLKDFLRHELIGLKMEVIESKNKNLIGIQGTIVDETKNTLVVKTPEKSLTLVKDQVTLKIFKDNHEIKVNGEILVGRPEDRLKK
ncbi:MAG: ribonuclease P protein subunit [Nanoarchaeota archaeon]